MLLLACGASPPGGRLVRAQVPGELARERAEFARWLSEAPTSPFRALVQHPMAPRITLGPADADVPLPGLDRYALEENNGRVSLIAASGPQPVARDRVTPLGTAYQMLVSGPPGRSVVTVFGAEPRSLKLPAYYPYAMAWRFTVRLDPVTTARPAPLLGSDGTEVDATEAGTIRFTLQGTPVRLRVFRVPTAGGEESELEIYFRDGTNDHGTYPAGRFVNLVPTGDGRYVLDLNRARNPFCAYSTVYACPAPWRGNVLPVAVTTGEKYRGGGLSKPPQL